MSDNLTFARLEVPAFFLNNLKPESRELWAGFNGQLVNVEKHGYMGSPGEGRKCVTGLTGIHAEGIELYVPLEYLNYNLTAEEMEIAELLYHSFWQREEYTEKKEEIIAAVFKAIGEPKQPEKKPNNTVSFTHAHPRYPLIPRFRSYWTPLADKEIRVSISEIKPFGGSISNCLKATLPFNQCPEEVQEGLFLYCD